MPAADGLCSSLYSSTKNSAKYLFQLSVDGQHGSCLQEKSLTDIQKYFGGLKNMLCHKHMHTTITATKEFNLELTVTYTPSLLR